MTKQLYPRQWRHFQVIGSLTLPLILCVGNSARAQERVELTAPALIAAEQASGPSTPNRAAAQPAVAGYSLDQCIQIGLAQQPAVAAARASLAAAQTGKCALDNMRFAALISRDIPVRRQQACIGVSIAAAALDQAERETVYAVTRLYYTVAFAREQKKVADSVVANMNVTREIAEAAVKAGSRDVTTSSVDKILVYQRIAESKQVDAQQGIHRALAALREAMGLDSSCPLNVAIDQLPAPRVSVHCDEIVALALSRRAELVQALGASEVTCLEVKAQGKKPFSPMVNTFAAGSDIHARLIPQGEANTEYRPSAVGPEMPVLLVGSRLCREQRAKDFHDRSVRVVDKTRGLIALEAEDVFLKWQEANSKAPLYQEATAKGRKLADDTRDDFRTAQRVKPEDVLTNEVIASQAQASYNEVRYHLILALAALERITGGGFCAGLTGQP